MFRARTERRPQRAPQGFKPRYAVVQPESPSPHRRWAVPRARGRACACIQDVRAPFTSSHDSVDAVRTGDVRTGEEKREVQPPAEPDDHWTRNIPGRSGVPIGQQLAVLVHRVDAVLTGDVPAGEEK